MKKVALSIVLAGIGTVAWAQVVEKSTTTTTTSAGDGGVITEYEPGSTIVLKEKSGPVRYKMRDSVTYVTKSGKTISADEARTRIRVGIPVHVEATGEGEDRVVSRVVVDED